MLKHVYLVERGTFNWCEPIAILTSGIEAIELKKDIKRLEDFETDGYVKITKWPVGKINSWLALDLGFLE